MSKVHWKKKHRGSGIDVRCQDGGEIYLSMDWNGVTAWEYVATSGYRSAKSFAKFLREVADLVEDSAPADSGKHE